MFEWDNFEHPYFPQEVLQRRAPEPLAPENTLSVLLRHLRVLSFLFQTYHWEAKGSNSYGDHLLFERLYNESLPLIDALAEHTVGMFGPGNVDPNTQLQGMLNILGRLTLVEDSPIQNSVTAIEQFLVELESHYTQLQASNQTTMGLEDLLPSIARTHETFLYLLRQRLMPTYQR